MKSEGGERDISAEKIKRRHDGAVSTSWGEGLGY